MTKKQKKVSVWASVLALISPLLGGSAYVQSELSVHDVEIANLKDAIRIEQEQNQKAHEKISNKLDDMMIIIHDLHIEMVKNAN